MPCRRLLVVALAGGILLAAGGCMRNPFAKSNDDKDNGKSQAAIPVEVAPVVRGPIEAFIRTSRHLEAEQEVKVFARTANRVTALLVEEGDQVAKDQVLVRLEDDIQTTQAEKARVSVEKARREFGRLQALYDQKLISEQAYTDSKFELRQLELALEDAQRQLDYTRVVAPIAGTVTQRLVKEGDLVGLNQHLFDLVDFNSIVARVYVPQHDLRHLSEGQPVRVSSTALPGQELAGYVQRIAPVVESKTGTVKATVAFKDVGPLRPGMYVTVELVTARNTNALLIPRRALVHDQDQVFVYRLKPDRRVEKLPVERRTEDPLNVEPAAGFAEGDQIVVAGQTGLKDGATVRIPGDPDPAEKLADQASPPAAAVARKEDKS